MFEKLSKFGAGYINVMSDEERECIKMLLSEEGREPNPFYEGYSFGDFFSMLGSACGPLTPIEIKEVADEEYLKSPLFFFARKLCDIIERDGYIKLTKEGLLPLDVITELNVQDRLILDAPAGTCLDHEGLVGKLLRLLLLDAKIVRMQNKRMIFTKVSDKIISSNYKLFDTLFSTFTSNMNWKQIDGLPKFGYGVMGCCFQLILLQNYGHISRNCAFYSNSFLKLIDSGIEENVYLWYTFEVCLQSWGFVAIDKKENSPDYLVRRTELFDKIFLIKPFQEFVVEPLMSVNK